MFPLDENADDRDDNVDTHASDAEEQAESADAL